VDYFHFDVEQQLQNCVNNYVEIVKSSSKVQAHKEPEEDKKPSPIIDKHRE
jgi:hypothetical protein